MRHQRFLFLGLFLALLPFSSLHAATPFTDPGQQFLEQERRKKEQQLMEKPPSEIPAPKPTAPEEKPKAKGPCYQTDHIVFTKGVKLPAKVTEKIIADYTGRCLQNGDITHLMHALNNAYLEAGYVTTRVVPTKYLNNTLTLQILEGRIERVLLNKNTHLKDKTAVMMAFPGLKGKVLQLDDLSQGLDQINRLPSNNAKLTMWPGTEERTTEVRLENTPHDQLRLSMVYDNYGQEATGINRIRTSAEMDNLLGLNDMSSFHYIGSRDTNTLAMNASIPYGYWTASVDASYSEYLSIIDNAAELFGQSYNTNFTLNRVVYRGKNSKTSVEGMLNLKESTRMIGDVLLAPQPLTVARIGATHMIRTESNVWNFDAHYSRGLTILGAIADSTQPKDAPRAQFDKIDGGVTLFQPINQTVQLRSTLRGQYSFDSLYNSEQLTLGDNSTVRGFSQSNISGDSGLYTQNEFSFALPENVRAKLPWDMGNNVQPYSFVDAGYTKLKTDDQYSPIVGAGAGIRFNVTKYLNGDLAFAVPLYEGGRAEDNGAEIYVMLGARW